MDLAFLIPAVQQGGYILTVAAHDRHPSLNEDETLLARREEPLACKESQQGEDSNGVDTKAQQQQPDSKVASHDEKQQDMEGDFLSEIARLPRWDEAGEEAGYEHPSGRVVTFGGVGETCNEGKQTFVRGQVGGLIAGRMSHPPSPPPHSACLVEA